MDWFEQLTAAAEILPLEEAKQLLHSKQDVLERQHKQWQRRAEAQEAAAQAKARSVCLHWIGAWIASWVCCRLHILLMMDTHILSHAS